ncbi:MAG: FlgO family outer membrane protein [Elusimicrobiales bacterium]|nr:FlgO family outer membrane protein [Elusimicrobiales bacterium]
MTKLISRPITAVLLGMALAHPGRCEKARTAAVPAAPELSSLADKLREGIKDRPEIKLAVLEFPYADGSLSGGPAVVQERLTTLLAQDKKITLIERALLKKVMGELNLQASGAVGEETVKELGKLLGASAVVTGTLNDLKDETVEVNARIVETGTGLILAAAAGTLKRTWGPARPPEKPSDFEGKPLVQLAILLDTSNSMDGLINQARNQVWKIVNELNASEKSGSAPAIEVALYEYGNSGLGEKKGWVRQVLPFTRNLDRVAEELFVLKTAGGNEYCGRAIQDAVGELKWSGKDDVYKAIFIAGNEPFTQGTVDFRQAVAEAKAKGIFVNTIFCGRRQEGLATQWAAAAQLADGEYSSIDQSAPAAAVSAPQDDRIAGLGRSLDGTYIAYGSKGAGEKLKRERLESDISAGGFAAASERAMFKAAAPAAMAEYESSWDLVTALENGSMKRSEIKTDQLPEEFRKMDEKELEKTLDAKLAERKKIKEEILRLRNERAAWLAAEEKKPAAAPDTLDKAVIGAVRRQAGAKGYKFP